MSKPSYQEMEKRTEASENKSLERKRIEEEILEKQSILKRQNIDLVRKSIELSDIMRQLEDKNYDLELSRSTLEKTLAALRASEEKYRTILENIEDGYYEIDLDGNFTFFNDSLCRILGYSEDELPGMNISHFTDPETAKRGNEAFKKVYTTGKPTKKFDWEIMRKDGAKKHIEASVSLIKDAKGRGIGVRGIMRDATEPKEAEEKIQQQNEFLKNVIESLTHPFYVIDVRDYTVKMANKAANLGDLSGNTTCHELTHKKSKPCEDGEHSCPLREVKKTKKPAVVEHIHYDKDGNVRDIKVHCYPIFDSDGNVVQVIEYCLDITERKRAEEKAKQSQKALRTMFEATPFGTIIVGKDKKIRHANDASLA